jgi:hypothetical protein
LLVVVVLVKNGMRKARCWWVRVARSVVIMVVGGDHTLRWDLLRCGGALWVLMWWRLVLLRWSDGW